MRSIHRVQDEICIILTSIDDKDAARKLAHGLVDARLAACAQISARGVSIYRWQGAVQSSDEYYLSIKTSAEAMAQAVSWLEARHPYKAPEIICLQGTAARAYHSWIQQQAMPVS